MMAKTGGSVLMTSSYDVERYWTFCQQPLSWAGCNFVVRSWGASQFWHHCSRFLLCETGCLGFLRLLLALARNPTTRLLPCKHDPKYLLNHNLREGILSCLLRSASSQKYSVLFWFHLVNHAFTFGFTNSKFVVLLNTHLYIVALKDG